MVKNELRKEQLGYERELRDVLPFRSEADKKRFRILEDKVKVLQGRLNKIERRERVERNKALFGFNQLN